MGDEDFAFERVPGRIYFSKEFTKAGTTNRKARFGTRVFKIVDRTKFATVKKEIVLRTSHGQRYQLKALFSVDDREIDTLHLQVFTKATGVPHQSSEFCLYGDEIDELVEFAMAVRSARFEDGSKVRIG
jgi:hypothetical protein